MWQHLGSKIKNQLEDPAETAFLSLQILIFCKNNYIRVKILFVVNMIKNVRSLMTIIGEGFRCYSTFQ